MAKGASEPAFPSAGRPCDVQVMARANPVATDERRDLCADQTTWGLVIDRKASAKAREFEKWCGQNEGDNSAPRMLKNRPAIVPLKTEV